MSNTDQDKPDEIEKALELCERFGSAPSEDAAFGDLLEAYRELISKTDSMMAECGVTAACGRCASVKGSCCFAGMADGYGALSLYLNLLMGSKLTGEAEDSRSCRFVGEKGCGLKARHSFCLNYFCPELLESLGKEVIEKILLMVGKQLHAGWELERALAMWISRNHASRRM